MAFEGHAQTVVLMPLTEMQRSRYQYFELAHRYTALNILLKISMMLFLLCSFTLPGYSISGIIGLFAFDFFFSAFAASVSGALSLLILPFLTISQGVFIDRGY